MSEWLNQPLSLLGLNLPFSPLDLLLRFIIPVVSFVLAATVISLIIRRIGRKHLEDEAKRDGLFKWTRRILRVLVFVGILLSIGSLLGAEAYSAFGDFFRILNTPFFSSGNTSVSVVTLLLIIPVVVASSWIGRLVRRGLETGALKRFGLDAEQSFTVGRLVRYSVMALVFVFGLSIIGIDLSAIGVLFGVLGIGIGFGLQSLIADFFAGISLIGMGHIKEGDRIRVGEHDGVIRQIRLMNTELTTYENETLIIPNGHLTSGAIHNYSYKDRRVVIVNSVDVSYNADLDTVISVLQGIADRNPWLQHSSETIVRVTAFADSGISMQLRTWIKDVSDRAEALSWTNLEIWRSFKQENIEIPFPQRVVHQAINEGLPTDTDSL